MFSKIKQASLAVEKLRRVQTSVQVFQYVPSENPLLLGLDGLCGHPDRLEECMRSYALLGPVHLQDQAPGGAGSRRKNTDPAMLLQDIVHAWPL